MSSSQVYAAVNVPLGQRSYSIVIGHHLLEQESSWKGMPQASTALIVTNQTVQPLYEETLRRQLQKMYKRVLTCVLPDGEQYKTWEHLQHIFDVLLKHACDRKTVLFALGGGVVGDMTGFAAACYMRGVPFVQVPTTLLAQVDSSVGGKTAINHPVGKNMIGAFYQPCKVVCDQAVFATLPRREFLAGLAEVIKYGVIADWTFFLWLEQHIDEVLNLQPLAMAHVVQRSCQLKADIVGADERESDLRAILNFGHTFGHAIEAGLGYGQWLHGEAVACGMVMAARLSQAMGYIDGACADRIEALIQGVGLPVVGPVLDGVDSYLHHMQVDKKAADGQIRFVLVRSPGQAVVETAPMSLVRQIVQSRCASHTQSDEAH